MNRGGTAITRSGRERIPSGRVPSRRPVTLTRRRDAISSHRQDVSTRRKGTRRHDGEQSPLVSYYEAARLQVGIGLFRFSVRSLLPRSSAHARIHPAAATWPTLMGRFSKRALLSRLFALRRTTLVRRCCSTRKGGYVGRSQRRILIHGVSTESCLRRRRAHPAPSLDALSRPRSWRNGKRSRRSPPSRSARGYDRRGRGPFGR
jgi:hypothetical protein